MAKDPEIRCGISVFPWSSKLFSFFTKIRWFVVFASLAAIFLGSEQNYFIRTMHIWRNEYGYSESLTEWIIVGNELTQGFLALFLIHYSSKRAGIIWTAGSLAFFVVACFSLLIPELVHPLESKNGTLLNQYESQQMCAHPKEFEEIYSLRESYWSAIFIMIAYQISLGISVIYLIIHSTLYIDAHVSINNSIMLIGVFYAAKELGFYVGVHFTWMSIVGQGTNIFGTAVWITVFVLLLIFAGILSLYPKYLNESIKLKSVVSSSDVIFKPDLQRNIRSVFRNKPVLLNIISSVLFVSAIGNFNLIENKFIQSKFLVPDEIIFHGTLTSQVVSSIVKPIFVVAIIILSAFLISKFSIRAFSISLYNSIVPLILMIFFFIYIFLECDNPKLPGKQGNVLRAYCMSHCDCSQTLFEPVCFEGHRETYFSPCYAGCDTFEYKNGVKIFLDCTCGNTGNATSVTCANESCNSHWITMVIFRTVSSVLTASMIVGHIVLNLYASHYTERPYVLAMEMSLIGLVAYGPVRAIYLALTSYACKYVNNESTCLFHESTALSKYLISITILLLVASSVCSFFMAFYLRGFQIYKQEDYMDIITTSKSMTSLKSVTHSAPRRLATHEEETEEMLEENERSNVLMSRNSIVEVEVHTGEDERDVGVESHAEGIVPQNIEKEEENNIQKNNENQRSVHETSL